MYENVSLNLSCDTVERQKEELLKKQLHQQELLQDAIAQTVPFAFFVVDNRNDNILYFNNQFCRMWGTEKFSDKMRKGDIKNADIIPYCLELVADKSAFIEACKPLQDENNRVIVEDEILFTDGRTIRRFSGQVRDEVDNYIGRFYIFEDITKTKDEYINRLEHISRHDHLTNIANRFYLEEFLRYTYSSVNKREDVLLIMDLDNFKVINDSFGHSIGDKVLVSVANCLKKKLRSSDFIARLGGDEFAIFLSNTSIDVAKLVANKILDSISNESFYIDDNYKYINVTASIGLTMIDDAIDMRRLFSFADTALYEAKKEGKNRVVVLNNGKAKDTVIHNNKILTLIQNSLAQDKFQIHLQPIYNADNELIHHEVLVRMLDDTNKILYPATFIPIAERYGLMPLIDKWVIKNTISLLNEERNLNVFINLSGSSVCDDTLLEWIESTLKHSSVTPKQIGFEITETTAIKDLEKVKMWIHKLKELGCHFALDDFGVGFSSFSYLNMLPVDYLKIDGTFIRGLDSDPTKLALVKAMNVVAHTLGKKTIAEFVENEAIWTMLQELGVDCGQGYFLGEPAPVEYLKNRF